MLLTGMFKRAKKRPDAEALECFVDAREGSEPGSAAALPTEKAEQDYQALNRLWDELGSYPIELEPELDIKEAGSLANNRYRRSTLMATAASLLIAVAVLFFFSIDGSAVNHYQTVRGEQKTINLADGSVMHLNSATRVTVSFDDKFRHVELETGEALFDVAKDPDRKFVVSSDKGAVEAIGTLFNVNLLGSFLIVTVAEGKVLVSNDRQDVSEQSAEIVVEGQQMVVDESGRLTGSKPDDVRQALAWTQGKIILEGNPMECAVELVNRHSDHRIAIRDSRLRSLPVFGVFNAGDTEGFLSALEKTYDLDVVKDSEGLTYLVYRSSEAKQ